MSGDNDFLRIFISWFPLLLLVVVWFFFMWRGGLLRRGQMTNSQYLEEHLKETKRANAALESLLTKIDERITKLDSRSPS